MKACTSAAADAADAAAAAAAAADGDDDAIAANDVHEEDEDDLSAAISLGKAKQKIKRKRMDTNYIYKYCLLHSFPFFLALTLEELAQIDTSLMSNTEKRKFCARKFNIEMFYDHLRGKGIPPNFNHDDK